MLLHLRRRKRNFQHLKQQLGKRKSWRQSDATSAQTRPCTTGFSSMSPSNWLICMQSSNRMVLKFPRQSCWTFWILSASHLPWPEPGKSRSRKGRRTENREGDTERSPPLPAENPVCGGLAAQLESPFPAAGDGWSTAAPRGLIPGDIPENGPELHSRCRLPALITQTPHGCPAFSTQLTATSFHPVDFCAFSFHFSNRSYIPHFSLCWCFPQCQDLFPGFGQ